MKETDKMSLRGAPAEVVTDKVYFEGRHESLSQKLFEEPRAK